MHIPPRRSFKKENPEKRRKTVQHLEESQTTRKPHKKTRQLQAPTRPKTTDPEIHLDENLFQEPVFKICRILLVVRTRDAVGNHQTGVRWRTDQGLIKLGCNLARKAPDHPPPTDSTTNGWKMTPISAQQEAVSRWRSWEAPRHRQDNGRDPKEVF